MDPSSLTEGKSWRLCTFFSLMRCIGGGWRPLIGLVLAPSMAVSFTWLLRPSMRFSDIDSPLRSFSGHYFRLPLLLITWGLRAFAVFTLAYRRWVDKLTWERIKCSYLRCSSSLIKFYLSAFFLLFLYVPLLWKGNYLPCVLGCVSLLGLHCWRLVFLLHCLWAGFGGMTNSTAPCIECIFAFVNHLLGMCADGDSSLVSPMELGYRFEHNSLARLAMYNRRFLVESPISFQLFPKFVHRRTQWIVRVAGPKLQYEKT